MTVAVTELALGKVNLDLLITGKRPDGYHELDSMVVFTELADELVIEPADELSLAIDGPFADVIDVAPQQNLVMRAAKMFRQFTWTDAGAKIRLTKNLPVAAGIGGGSADAAACLRALNRFWQTGRSDFVLRELSLELGADMAVCMYSKPARMRGLGERVDPVRGLPELWLLLVNPLQPLSTAAVFGNLTVPDEPRLRAAGFPARPSPVQIGYWLSYTRNDLEPPAIDLMPGIATILAELAAYDACVIARMSGSGPTCFGLFLDQNACEQASAELREKLPDHWIACTRTIA